MGSSVTVVGADTLARSLIRAAGRISELKEAHMRAAKIVGARSVTTAPVLTGRLAMSVRTGATANAATIRAGNGRVPYAGPVHWGWPARNIHPQPFIAAAAQATEPVWVGAYRFTVQRILDQVRGT